MTETLQDLVGQLPRLGNRRAAGLRGALAARWWSYRRLHAESLRFARLLADAGIGRGDCVAIQAPNSPEWIAAAFGTLLRAAVVLPVDADATAARRAALLDVAAARILLHDGVDTAGVGIPTLSLLTTGDPAAEGDVVVPATASDAAVRLFTSGSTQEPRSVVLTHANLCAQVDAFARWRLVARPHARRLLSLSPLSHAQGLVMGMLVPLSLGVSVLYSVSVEPPDVLRTIRLYRVHALLAVPRVQALLAAAVRDLPSTGGRTLGERVDAIRWFPLRRHVLFLATRRSFGLPFSVLLVGGAPLAAADERFWYECGYVVVQGYGLTESSALVSFSVNHPFGAKLGSVGRALRHQDVCLAADGELLVRGPSVAAPREYLATGDLARIDGRGRLWLVGRKSDLIVTAEGLNVHAGDVESALRDVSGVRDAVVADVDGSGRVHAVLLADGVLAADAVAAANVSLEPHERVRSWTLWRGEDFPRTALLKVRRGEVVATVRGDAPAPHVSTNGAVHLDDVRADGDARRRIELLADYLTADAGDSRDADVAVEDLGLSSLDAVELAAALERRRARVLPDLVVTPQVTLAELRTAAASPKRGPKRLPTHQPRWSRTAAGRLGRAVVSPLAARGWAHGSASLVVDGQTSLPDGACVYAVAPHRHWLDALAVRAALPTTARTMTATNRTFEEWFSAPGASRSASIGAVYYVLWPLLFEFAIVPNFGSTRVGLQDLGAALDRGVSAISFPKGLAPPGVANERHEQGVACVALDAAAPVVPVWIDGNDDLRVAPRRDRPRLTVRFGEPLASRPGVTPGDVVAHVETEFRRLGGARAA